VPVFDDDVHTLATARRRAPARRSDQAKAAVTRKPVSVSLACGVADWLGARGFRFRRPICALCCGLRALRGVAAATRPPRGCPLSAAVAGCRGGAVTRPRLGRWPSRGGSRRVADALYPTTLDRSSMPCRGSDFERPPDRTREARGQPAGLASRAIDPWARRPRQRADKLSRNGPSLEAHACCMGDAARAASVSERRRPYRGSAAPEAAAVRGDPGGTEATKREDFA